MEHKSINQFPTNDPPLPVPAQVLTVATPILNTIHGALSDCQPRWLLDLGFELILTICHSVDFLTTERRWISRLQRTLWKSNYRDYNSVIHSLELSDARELATGERHESASRAVKPRLHSLDLSVARIGYQPQKIKINPKLVQMNLWLYQCSQSLSWI